MVRPTPIVSGPLVRVMVCPVRPWAKLMVSPPLALLISSRSEPGPLSWLLVTVRVLSRVRSSIGSS
jgi:hypothetical protein